MQRLSAIRQYRASDLAQARQMVAEAIRIYSSKRLHTSLKRQTPDAVHRASLTGLIRPVQSSKLSTEFRTAHFLRPVFRRGDD
ncbi:transposase [Comamonas odontotermitis]|nr:transposase [Comamonas odontotermitis]